jgi:hypothetical protein
LHCIIWLTNGKARIRNLSNLRYSRGRGQEDCDLKPAWANSSQKNPSQKRAGRVAQGVCPEFKPQYHKKKKLKSIKPKAHVLVNKPYRTMLDSEDS